MGFVPEIKYLVINKIVFVIIVVITHELLHENYTCRRLVNCYTHRV